MSRTSLLEAIDACPSTNTLLLDQAEAERRPGNVVITDRQTAGRGSRGAAMAKPFEASLTFSLVVAFCRRSGEASTGLSLVVGLAVVRALESLGAKEEVRS